MPSHKSRCVVCDEDVWCHMDEHALSCGGGCYSPEPTIDFCSLECFNWLRDKMVEREAFARDEYPQLFVAATDRNWAERIEIAKAAREGGRILREGK